MKLAALHAFVDVCTVQRQPLLLQTQLRSHSFSQATEVGFCVPRPTPWRLCDPWRTSHQNMQYYQHALCPTHTVIKVLNTCMSCLEEWLSPKVERSSITELFSSQREKVLGPAAVPKRAVEQEELFSWEHTLPQKLTITLGI